VTSRRANGEGSIFPYRNGFAAYVWITTPSGKRQRKYVYGRSREIVHGRWVELTRKAARGPVVTKVPIIGQFLNRWLEDRLLRILPRSRTRLTRATSRTTSRLESVLCGLIAFASLMCRHGSIAYLSNASAARRDRTSVGRSAARHGAARPGSAVIGWLHRARSRTSEPSCVQG
jgi:hypothetical protein